jgi:hypothetical protein
MAHVDVTRNGGSHDGLYAARVYWQDRRRLLRRLRQSSGCSRVRSCSISGFGGLLSPCRRRWANGSWPGVGKFPETEQRPYTGLHAARLYWHDCRPLLRPLRQSSGCSPVRSCRISGFGGILSPCRRCWANGSWPGVGKFPETEQRPYTGLYAARMHWHDCRLLLRPLRQSSRRSPVRSRRISGSGGDTRYCGRASANGSPGADIRPCSC